VCCWGVIKTDDTSLVVFTEGLTKLWFKVVNVALTLLANCVRACAVKLKSLYLSRVSDVPEEVVSLCFVSSGQVACHSGRLSIAQRTCVSWAYVIMTDGVSLTVFTDY
jgi:hypothetical protein